MGGLFPHGPAAWSGACDELGAPLGTDAFQGQRVVHPYQLFDNYHAYEIDSREWGSLTASGGTITHLPNESAAKLEVTSAAGSRAMLRTHTHFRYQAGRGMSIRNTVIHGSAPTSTAFVRRSYTSGSVVETRVAQTDWSHDRLDTRTQSLFRLDVEHDNIYEMKIAWLGAKGAEARINGHLVHVDDNTNALHVPYMTTAILPMTCEIVNTGGVQYRRWGYFSDQNGYFFETQGPVAAAYIKHCCTSVASDGGAKGHSNSFSAPSGQQTPGVTTRLPVISIRPKLLYNSIVNRAIITPTFLSGYIATKEATAVVTMNPTVTGGTWVSAGATSSVEYNITATAVSDGEPLHTVFGAAGTSFGDDISGVFNEVGRKLRLNYDGTVQDTLSVTGLCKGGGATTTDIQAALSWLESR